jgi:hypothetical protein
MQILFMTIVRGLSRTHVDVRYHFVRDYVENGAIRLEYCPMKEMMADALTKPLLKGRHVELVKRMGLEIWGSATGSST